MNPRKRKDEVERIAKLMHRANQLDLFRKYPKVYHNPPRSWELEYDCIRESYRVGARAVLRDRARRVRARAKRT